MLNIVTIIWNKFFLDVWQLSIHNVFLKEYIFSSSKYAYGITLRLLWHSIYNIFVKEKKIRLKTFATREIFGSSTYFYINLTHIIYKLTFIIQIVFGSLFDGSLFRSKRVIVWNNYFPIPIPIAFLAYSQWHLYACLQPGIYFMEKEFLDVYKIVANFKFYFKKLLDILFVLISTHIFNVICMLVYTRACISWKK